MNSAADTPRHFTAADFDYRYPPELIAQHPAPERGADRLLVLERATGAIAHRMFRDLPELVHDGDVLVVNRSRVIPARLHAIRDNGRPAELLLVHAEPDGTWLAMVHPGGKLKVGRRVRFGDDAHAEIVDVVGGGLRRVRFSGALGVHDVMNRYGSVPLPPYITHAPDAEDAERYQTIYAKDEGSVAAPTAGLHFTEEIFDRVRARGAEIAELVLHVGPGTFKPVEVDDPEAHTMHAEWYSVPDEAAAAVNRAKAGGGRIWAIGTTSARVLETVGDNDGKVRPGSGWTDLFIHPPFTFHVVDALLTNFHLPRSTLLMLVAAFAGYEHTMEAYRAAVAERYRLYSYGDAMAIV